MDYLDNAPEVTDIVIEGGICIGENVSVLSSVRIGIKSIIGAESIACNDIPEYSPEYSIASGNPCRVIKRWEDGRRVKESRKELSYETCNISRRLRHTNIGGVRI